MKSLTINLKLHKMIVHFPNTAKSRIMGEVFQLKQASQHSWLSDKV